MSFSWQQCAKAIRAVHAPLWELVVHRGLLLDFQQEVWIANNTLNTPEEVFRYIQKATRQCWGFGFLTK